MIIKGLLYLGTWAVAIKGLLYLDLDERCLRGFFTSILMIGNQGASLSRKLNCGDQGASPPQNLSCSDQWGLSTLEPELWRPKGILYLDLDERCPRGFSTSKPRLWRSRGFFSSILIKGSQGAFLPRNLGYGDQGAYLP